MTIFPCEEYFADSIINLCGGKYESNLQSNPQSKAELNALYQSGKYSLKTHRNTKSRKKQFTN